MSMRFEVLDGSPLLNASYRLRYATFCDRKGFLSPDLYPDKAETDVYDHYSIHIGCVDGDVMLGTLRMVMPPPHGFPIIEHCELFPEWSSVAGHRMAEISRLALAESASRNPAIIFGIYKLLYHVSRQYGITHWFAAMEKSLFKLLKRGGFTFDPIGPEQDYYGLVTPYLASIDHIEAHVKQNNPRLYAEFLRLDPL